MENTKKEEILNQLYEKYGEKEYSKALIFEAMEVWKDLSSLPSTEERKTAEEILSKHTGEEGIYLTKGMIRGDDALEAMQEYTSQQTEAMAKEIERLKSELREIADTAMVGGVVHEMAIKALKEETPK